MKIAKQTPDELIISTSHHAGLRLLGLALLVIGLLVIFMVKAQPLGPRELQDPSLLRQQQAGRPEVEPDFQEPSPSEAGYRFARYIGQSLLNQERPLLVAAALGMMIGLVMLAAPFGRRRAEFDGAHRRVVFKQPGWFFHSRSESYAFGDISEVRVERDRTGRRNDRNYGVSVVIGHSEGAPLSRSYIFYKTVFPLSDSFRYDYPTAEKMVDQVRAFIAPVPVGAA